MLWSSTTGQIWQEGVIDPALTKFINSSQPAQKSIIGAGSIFIVHGHDQSDLNKLTVFLKRLDLTPIILAESDGAGMTIIEALESDELGIGNADFGIVLLTDDDFGYSKRDGIGKTSPRARQNVIFEMGMLMVKLTRRNVAMLVKSNVELPSDTKGIIYHEYKTDLIEDLGPTLIKRFQRAGLHFSDTQTTTALFPKKQASQSNQ